MPSIVSRAKELERKFHDRAPMGNRDKIMTVLNIYRDRKNVPFLAVQNMVLALYSPSLFSTARQRGKDAVEKMYENFLSKYQNATAYPDDNVRTLRYTEKLQERRDRILGIRRTYQLHVILYTQARKMDPERPLPKQEELGRAQKRGMAKKKHKGLIQFWKGYLTVSSFNTSIFEEQKWKMTDRGTREFRKLYPICMTDDKFRDREDRAPGYLDAIYLLDWTDLGRVKRGAESGRNPAAVRQRAAGEKFAIHYKYLSTQLDTSKRTFAEALRRQDYHASECWLNTLHDNYDKTLLRPEKARNRISRQDILEVLGRTEEDIKEGLTVEEVLPFFQKYKLKLRVFDVFYNLIYRYDPEVPNFNHRAFYCLTDGNHIYTLNKDLESLAQKSPEDVYRVVAGSNFHIPDKPTEKADYRILEHIDELLDILRDEEKEEEQEERISYLVHKYDNLEAVVWQLYEAGYRPSIKDGAGRLSWVSLTVNRHTFVVRSQQMIDWAIDGMMEVQDAGVYNRMHDAKMEFHYQLFRGEHRSYYSPLDLEILDECRTTANVGWIRSLGSQPVSLYNPHFRLSLRDLAEIDISKAYTGAFMRINLIPVFNEFDLWQPYNSAEEPVRNLSLYLVEASEFDLFLNRRYCLVYGQFLKQLPKEVSVKAVKHPSMIKKVNYRALVEELWKTPISEDPEEDQTLKKTIANCNYGMLEKQINRTQKSKLFDTYEDAKFFQSMYGGEITFIKQYELREGGRGGDPKSLDKGVGAEEGDVDEVPTGRMLFILNLKAESSLTNGFRYIKELLMQHHNFYLERSYRLLRENGVEAYSVKTDALTVPAHKLERVAELLNWESGIGSWTRSKKEEVKFPCMDAMLELRQNKMPELLPVPQTQPLDLTVEDEYDSDKLCRLFEEHRRVMVRAEFAGCGKSYACKQMEQRGHAVLFVCPTNKLADNYGEHGCTINRFFGIGLTEESRMARFDDSGYDTIVFDEIFFSSVRKLARIKRYCETNPDKIVIATGDTSQLESIDCITNQHDYDKYYNRCIDLIFPVSMFFRENKRLRDPQDKETLTQFKRDIFDEGIPVETTVRKYFALVKDFSTLYNIAYKNSTCQRVSEEARQRIQQKREPYEVGEVLLCRSWFKVKRVVFHVNYEYTIAEVAGEMITLSNGAELPLTVVRKNFIHNYCRTCHSFQGSSVDEAITIFDWRFLHVNRKWLYTAVTRATDLKRVSFYDYDEQEENEEQMMQYFQKKVDRYKAQDRKAKRRIDDEGYITRETLAGWVGKSCNSCGDCLSYSRLSGRVECNLSAQRVDNGEGHTRENVLPYCIYCNTAMSNREA